MGKICKKCQTEKPDDLFEVGRNQCKACRKIQKANWYKNNAEREINRNREWKAKNANRVKYYINNYNKSEAGRERARRYHIKHREELNEKSRKYNEKHKEELRLYMKDYCERNRERMREYDRWRQKNRPEIYREKSRKRRNLKETLDYNFSVKDEVDVFNKFDNKCFNCGSVDQLTIDHHYPLSKGHGLAPDNAVLLCRICNGMKFTKQPEEFYTEEQLNNLHSLGIRNEILRRDNQSDRVDGES